MKNQNIFIVTVAVIAAVIAAFWLSLAAPGYTGNEINLTREFTTQPAVNHQLRMIVLWICAGIAVIIFSAMFFSIVLHRKSGNHTASHFSHSTRAEVMWTVIPVLILVVTAVPATGTLVNMEVAPETEMAVNNAGFQWRLKDRYVEAGRPLVLPGAKYGQWVQQQNNPMVDEQVEIERLWRREELMEMDEDERAAQCAACEQPASTPLAPVFGIEPGGVVQAKTIAQIKSG